MGGSLDPLDEQATTQLYSPDLILEQFGVSSSFFGKSLYTFFVQVEVHFRPYSRLNLAYLLDPIFQCSLLSSHNNDK